MAAVFSNRFRFSPAAPLMLAFCVLVLPLKWLLAAALAVAVHELFHVMAIRLCGGRVSAGEISFGRMKIHTSALNSKQELFCTAAGPVGSALLLLTARWMPRVALIGVIHCVFNLLPIYPMDGGRILCSGLTLVLGRQRAERICLLVSRAVSGLLFCAGVYLGVFYGFGEAVVVVFMAIYASLGRGMPIFSLSCEKDLANRAYNGYNRHDLNK